MIKTLGLTHIALKVADIKKSSEFYQQVFGVKEMYCESNFIQIQTPGSKDIIVFEKNNSREDFVKNFHFGFRLLSPVKIEDIISTVEKAGDKIKKCGEFVPGEPYVFFYDLDGYEVEIWYEKIPESLRMFN
ncbi:MAG: VOC family protein [Chitinophagaceae bacterium]